MFSVKVKLRKHTGMIKMKRKPKGGGLKDVIVTQSYNASFQFRKVKMLQFLNIVN